MDIGHRMKELRVHYGLTQQELADRSELSKGFISQLERNLTSPSVGTLLDIIQCLGTTPAEFFEHSKIEWIVPNAQKNGMEPLRVTLAPGGRSMELKPSEAEEFGYVLKGAIRIIRGTKSYLVKSGESFYLKGLKRHHIEAYGVKEAVFIWVSTPPNF